MRKILALDQASRVSGWAYFEDNKLITYGKIVANQSDIGDRLCYIRKEILSLIQKYEINEIYFEDIQLQNNVTNNVQTFKVLAEVFGVVYELATELNIKNQAVLSGTWKSKLQIKGASRPIQKQNAQIYINETYGIKATQDESDAICIGTYACLYGENRFDWS